MRPKLATIRSEDNTMRGNFWMRARRLLTLAFLGISLLAILNAPSLWFFRVAVVVTEFGHWLLLFPLLLLRFESGHGWGRLFQLLNILTILLFISPAIRAGYAARALPIHLQRAFGVVPEAGSRNPFELSRLWWPPRVETAPVQSFVFSTSDGSPRPADYYPAAAPNPRALVIALHGGGWNNGHPKQFADLYHYLAQQGYAVIVPAYRLAPRHPWPAQKQDVLALLASLRAKQPPVSISTKKVFLLGRSAGAQIALATAYQAKKGAIAGVIALYGPADLNLAYEHGRENDPLVSPRLLRDLLGGSPAEKPASYDDASAILHVGPDTPPTLLLHGFRDELVWFKQSQRLEAVLNDWRRPHVLIKLPWATHAFDLNLHGPGGQLSCYAVDYFLAALTPSAK